MKSNNFSYLKAGKSTYGKENIMKTGIIAAGTVAAAGLIFDMSAETTHAAELDANDAVIQTNVEAAVPETNDDANIAVEIAQENVEKTDAAVNEAQIKVDEAQQNVDSASEAADTAREDAEEAFDAAKSEAAEDDAAAQKKVEEAERDVAEADAKVQQASENVTFAKESLEEAENSANEAASESPVTENDITDKESELDDAQSALSDAETNLDEAKAAKDVAVAEADEAEAVKTSAAESVREAEAEKVAADDAVIEADEAAGQAAEDLQTAEDLKNGATDIRDTEQYKEEQEAKKMWDIASEKAETAAENTDAAAEDFANAETVVNVAEHELDSAVEELIKRETALSEAGHTREATEIAKEKAQYKYDIAAANAADADAVVSEATNGLKEAAEGVKTAETARDDADNAVRKASDAVDIARQDAEAAIDADISNAEKEAAEKQTAAEAAQDALDTAVEKYKKGTLGLIDWMLEKDGITKDQIQDLNFAREVLVNASEEDFTEWYGGNNTGLPEERDGKVVVIGDENDATNLENLLRSIEIMKKINELRATDDNYTGDLQRNASNTNFYFMATAEAGAMRGAGLMRHSSLTTSCENLAFGYSDPTVGWYNIEKNDFDRIKGELGITQITSMDDVARIETESDNQGVVVGHYTNLFWAADQVMGVGYTQYKRTSCYNASKASNYTNDSYNRAMHLYTVEEFEQLVKEYYQSVNKSACKDALEKAAAEQAGAEERLQSLKNGKDSAVETAIQEAMAELASRKTDAEQAARNLNEAKEVFACAEMTLEAAGTRKVTADQVLKNALELLNKAIDDIRVADTDYAYAEKARDEAKQTVNNAEAVLKDALDSKTSAASVLEEKRGALAEANAALDKAISIHEAAAKRLTDLTSDGTMDVLREQKRLADEVLQSALEDQIAKVETLKQVEAALAQAETDASVAKNTLQEAEDRLAEAVLARDAAKEAADRAAEELAVLREKYAPVLQAVADRDAAKERLNLAKNAYKEAESNLVNAQANLTQAQLAKALTADRLLRATGLSVDDALMADIEDPDFAFLNDYVSAIKIADDALSEARTVLSIANAELTTRKIDSKNAQRAYIAAVADLALIQDQEGMFQLNPVQVHDSKPAAVIADPNAIIVPDASGNASGLEVHKASVNTSKPILTKAESTGRVYSLEPVATGDTSNVMGLLAELLAGAGLMAIVFKRRKEKDKKVQ